MRFSPFSPRYVCLQGEYFLMLQKPKQIELKCCWTKVSSSGPASPLSSDLLLRGYDLLWPGNGLTFRKAVKFVGVLWISLLNVTGNEMTTVSRDIDVEEPWRLL